MLSRLERKIIRTILKLICAVVGGFFVYAQVTEGVAKLCYKAVSPCLFEAGQSASPVGFWILIFIYFTISLILLLSAVNEWRATGKNRL